MTDDIALRTEGLGKTFRRGRQLFRAKDPGTIAVDDVTLEVVRRGTLGIVGESGSGKTTLGRMIVGLTAPTAGRVIVDGVDTETMAPRDLHRRVQYVFQDPYSSLNPRHTVGRSVSVPLRHLARLPRDERPRRVAELLELTGLRPETAGRYPHELSGGQRQRVVIARAIAARPDVLVLDEAVSALDVSIQAQILSLLRDLQDEFGLTYLFISHDLAVVEALVDTVVVMSEGRVVEGGTRDEIFNQPQHPYTRRLLAAVPGGHGRRSTSGAGR